MDHDDFDRYAHDYRDLHRQSIGASGEEPEYFARYKMRDFAGLIQTAGLPGDGRFLDFGSGVGSAVEPLLAHLPTARLVCTDVSEQSLALSRERHGERVDYRHLHSPRLPFDDGFFDAAFACCVFHHIPAPLHRESLIELRRVIRPGGLLMIYEHNPYNPLTVRAVRNCPFDEHAVLITARRLGRSCQDAGFSILRRDYRVFFPAALAALRPVEDHLRWLPLGAQYLLALQP